MHKIKSVCLTSDPLPQQLNKRVAPQVMVVITQHTPKPAAQVPLEVPDLELHSEEMYHVPVVVAEPLLVQASFGNWTTLNSENLLCCLSRSPSR